MSCQCHAKALPRLCRNLFLGNHVDTFCASCFTRYSQGTSINDKDDHCGYTNILGFSEAILTGEMLCTQAPTYDPKTHQIQYDVALSDGDPWAGLTDTDAENMLYG